MKNAHPEHRKEVFEQVTAMLSDGSTQLPVEAIYPLTAIHKAVTHAAQEGRSGKILVRVAGK
jgi:NADPH:quinone reductase-like Zn-dependent oxidoreductase